MNRLGFGAAALVIAACSTVPHEPVTSASMQTAPLGVAALAAAVKRDSQRSDHESDATVRAQLAQEASGYAGACMAQAPQAAACLYSQALAQGLEAQAHPARALPLLKSMLQGLSSAEAADPNYDQAGPARVQALVLTRAPGWPLGPGDADEGVAAARRAVALHPQYPPNLLALAEALAKTGDVDAARDSYARAREAAQALPPGADRDDWLREAEQGLQKK